MYTDHRYVLYWRVNRELVSRLPAALACGLIRRGCSPANLVKRAPCYGRAAGVARSRRRQASTAGKASGPGDQARPRGLKPRGAAAAAARCVPSRRQRSSHGAGVVVICLDPSGLCSTTGVPAGSMFNDGPTDPTGVRAYIGTKSDERTGLRVQISNNNRKRDKRR